MSQEKLAFWVAIITAEPIFDPLTAGGTMFNSISELLGDEDWSPISPVPRSGKRSSLRASDFKKDSIRVKQAKAALSIGIVDTRVFMGPSRREIKERAVYADAVFSVRPVEFAKMTKTANVNNGASVFTLLPICTNQRQPEERVGEKGASNTQEHPNAEEPAE